MKTTRTTYHATTKHPAGYNSAKTDGVQTVTVTTQQFDDVVFRRCEADGFGCSKDYTQFAAATDEAAIREFFREHGCVVREIAVAPEFVEVDFLGLGYTAQTRPDRSGRLVRFLGSPGEYVATEFGPGAYFRTAEAAFDYYADEERQTAAAERRCPQM